MIWDFAAVLTLLVVVSGLIWAIDSGFFASKRLKRKGELPDDATDEQVAEYYRLPVVVDYARSFFPIFLIVLLLRSFLVEPFRIPSGSMVPTLLVGDFILVNKFVYGIRIPVLYKKIIELDSPKRGDVVVFRYPLDPSTPFIKRVVGLPGDVVRYHNKALFINGKQAPHISEGTYVGVRSATVHTGSRLFREELGGTDHHVILRPTAQTLSREFKVPPGHYFVLGDNRDNSRDSRFWGYVPDENLVGRAFYIWMNWDNGPNLGRIGTTIH